MKSDKILRIVQIITLGVFAVQLLNYVIQLTTTIFSKPENPLIPKYIWKYAAFNLSIMSIIMLTFGFYTLYTMQKTQRSLTIIYALFLIAVLVSFFGVRIYEFINSFNPYAT